MECQKIDKQMEMRSRQRLAKSKDPLETFGLLALRNGCKGIKSIGRKFRIWDQDNNKKISFDEFKWIFSSHASLQGMSDEMLEQVFSSFDRDSSGCINFDEFLFVLRPPMNDKRKYWVKLAFAKLDKTGDGVITVEDVLDVYDVTKHPKFLNGEWTKRQVCLEFLKSFGVDDHINQEGESPTIYLEEWMNYFSGVSASIDDDEYFILMVRNAWKI